MHQLQHKSYKVLLPGQHPTNVDKRSHQDERVVHDPANVSRQRQVCEQRYRDQHVFDQEKCLERQPTFEPQPMEADDQSSAGTNHKFTLYSF